MFTRRFLKVEGRRRAQSPSPAGLDFRGACSIAEPRVRTGCSRKPRREKGLFQRFGHGVLQFLAA